MTDLSDINMDGVTSANDFERLPEGKYLVRIEDTEKKQTQKELFDEAGNKLPPTFYLQFALKIYGGPNEGQTEFDGLNLWHPEWAGMAKAQLKSIQEATGVVSSNSDHYHGKWMILEVKSYTNKKGELKLKKIYSAAPAELVAQFAHVPPVPAKAPSPAATPAAHVSNVSHAGFPPFIQKQVAAAASAPAGSAGALPSWAQKKTA